MNFLYIQKKKTFLTAKLDEAGMSGNGSLMILAGKETYRKDPLAHFNYYTGGWNIIDIHYLAVRLLIPIANFINYNLRNLFN